MNLSFFSNDPPLVRRLAAQPLQSIRAFPRGAVGRIVGLVGRPMVEPLIAPLTGRACAAWFVRVSGVDVQARGDRAVVEARGAAAFTVRDETGDAIVRADDDASLLLAFDVNEALGIGGRPSPLLLRFLREHRSAEHKLAIDWRLSWQEGILAEGQQVAVVGRGRRENDPEAAGGDYRAAATRLVMMRGDDASPLFVSTFERSLRG